jgi:hypothetical protein
MDSIYSTPVGGMDPRFLKASALMAGRNPLPDLNSLREQQLKLAQQQYGPAIAKLDTLVKSDSPAKYMQADQELRTAWTPLAMKLGMDPVKDLTDQNVRTAFTFGRNALAGSLQEPIEAPNVPLEQIHGSLNSLYSRNPVNNEIKQEKPEEELKPVIGADGKPTLVQASQAAGRTPFNPSIFGAASLSDQSKEFAYQAYVATGKLPATFSRSPAMQATMLDYISQRAKQDGNSAASIAANGQLFTARQQAEKAYAPGGQNYKTIQSLNTAVAHLDTMRGLAAALDNGDVQLINRAKNAVATQFGGAAPTNIDAAAKVVGQEVTKAIVANGGGEAERRAAAEDFSTVKSWGQLSGTISTYLDLMRGQLDTQRNGYQQTLGRSDFDNKFLTSRARQALGGSGSSTPAGNSAGALSDQALLKKWGGG